MQHAERLTLAERREFLSASNNLSFAGTGRKQIYGLVEGVLCAQKYLGLAKKDKGIVRRYLVKISGLSVAQITRLIARWRDRGVIRPRALTAPPVPDAVTRPPISSCWPKTDGAHEGLSAPAVRRILRARIRSPRQWPNTKAWPRSRPPTSTTCGAPGPIAKSACPSHQDPLHGGEHWRAPQARSAREAGLRAGRQRCIRATPPPTARVFITSMLSTPLTQWQVVGCCETISEAHLDCRF